MKRRRAGATDDLFGAAPRGGVESEPLADSATILRRFAESEAAALVEAVDAVIAQDTFGAGNFNPVRLRLIEVVHAADIAQGALRPPDLHRLQAATDDEIRQFLCAGAAAHGGIARRRHSGLAPTHTR